jgi:acyl dehydratase
MAVCQRLVTDGVYSEIANVAGLGIDDTRFHEPVRPGDRLTAHIEIPETRPLEHRDDRGLVVVDQRLDDDGTTVLTSSALTLVERV